MQGAASEEKKSSLPAFFTSMYVTNVLLVKIIIHFCVHMHPLLNVHCFMIGSIVSLAFCSLILALICGSPSLASRFLANVSFGA